MHQSFVCTTELDAIALAKGFTVQLTDARCPTCCPRCFSAFACALSKLPLAVLKLRKDHHLFWDACMATLTAPRDKDGTIRLRKVLLLSMVACPDRASHRKFVYVPIDDPLHAFIDSLYMCLIHSLQSGKDAARLRAQPHKGFPNSKNLWPAAARQLFPHGNQGTVQMLVQWSSELFSILSVAILACVISLACPLAMPRLLESATRERAVWLICQLMHGKWCARIDGWPGGAPDWHPNKSVAVLWCDMPQETSMEYAADFLHVLFYGVDAQMLDVHSFCDGYELVLFDAVQIAAPSLPDRSAYTLPALYHVSISLLAILRLPPSRLAPIFRRKYDSHARELSAITVLQLHLERHATARRCANRSCGKYVHDSETGRAFPACSQCRASHYCSPVCQRQDWKATDNPHKAVCPLLAKVLAGTEPRLGSEPFRTAFLALGLEDEQQLALFMWASTRDDVIPSGGGRRMKDLLDCAVAKMNGASGHREMSLAAALGPEY